MKMMKKKQAKYGGAERPFDWTSEKVPISAMIVGTKSGSEAKETLLEVYISGSSDVRWG
jgi:hypothetical protein